MLDYATDGRLQTVKGATSRLCGMFIAYGPVTDGGGSLTGVQDTGRHCYVIPLFDFKEVLCNNTGRRSSIPTSSRDSVIVPVISN